MSKAGAAGRALFLAIAVSVAACGPATGTRAPSATQVLPASGPVALATVKRLLLVDGARAGQRIVAVGDRGWIVYSDDEGASWKRAVAPEAPLLTAVTFVDGRRGWAVGHDATILASTDSGATWTRQFSAPAEQRPLLDLLFLDPRHGIAVGAYGAYYETGDGGQGWAARKIIAEDRHFNGIVRIPAGAAAGAGRLLIFGEEGTILASDDEGRTWAKFDSPYKGSLFGAVVARDGAVIAFGLRGKIFRSADAGASWSAVANASIATLMGGTRMPDGTIVLVGAAGTVLASRDDGRTFAPLAGAETARVYSNALAGRAGNALVLGEAGARVVALTPAGGAAR